PAARSMSPPAHLSDAPRLSVVSARGAGDGAVAAVVPELAPKPPALAPPKPRPPYAPPPLDEYDPPPLKPFSAMAAATAALMPVDAASLPPPDEYAPPIAIALSMVVLEADGSGAGSTGWLQTEVEHASAPAVENSSDAEVSAIADHYARN